MFQDVSDAFASENDIVKHVSPVAFYGRTCSKMHPATMRVLPIISAFPLLNVPENLGSRIGYTVMPLKSEGNFCITPIFVGRACGILRGMSCFVDQL